VSHNGWLLTRRGRILPVDVSDIDTHRDSITSRCGRRLFYSLFVFFGKLAAGLGLGMSNFALEYAGYLVPCRTDQEVYSPPGVPSGPDAEFSCNCLATPESFCGDQPPEVAEMLRILVGLVPASLGLLSLGLLWFYPITDEMRKVPAGLPRCAPPLALLMRCASNCQSLTWALCMRVCVCARAWQETSEVLRKVMAFCFLAMYAGVVGSELMYLLSRRMRVLIAERRGRCPTHSPCLDSEHHGTYSPAGRGPGCLSSHLHLDASAAQLWSPLIGECRVSDKFCAPPGIARGTLDKDYACGCVVGALAEQRQVAFRCTTTKYSNDLNIFIYIPHDGVASRPWNWNTTPVALLRHAHAVLSCGRTFATAPR
jgi:hypothetical protein